MDIGGGENAACSSYPRFVFIGLASALSAGRVTRFDRNPLTLASAIRSTLLIFVALEVIFVGLGWFVGSELELADRLGTGWVALANALAAIGMTATVAFASREASRRIHAAH